MTASPHHPNLPLRAPNRSATPAALRQTWFWGCATGLATLTAVPFLAASWLTPPDTLFTGLLLNPMDGFSYLAKMRQAATGSWAIQLPYTLEDHQNGFVYLQYVLLGKVSTITSLPLIWVYHLGRMAAALFMLALLHVFAGRAFAEREQQRTAFLFAAVGSGLTWLTSLGGVLGTDVTVPESATFAAALSNPHFPLAVGLSLVVAAAVLGGSGGLSVGRVLLAGAANAGVALIQPFLLVTEVAVTGMWVLLLLVRGQESIRSLLGRLRYAVLIVGPACVIVLFMLSRLYADPVLREWTAQNATPSPSPLSYLIGYGALLPLAILGAVRILRGSGSLGVPTHVALFIVAWAAAGCLLLYAPFPLQRRMSEGLVVPLAVLATAGLFAPAFPERLRLFTRAMVVAVGLAGCVWLSSVSVAGALALGAPHYATQDDVAALNWLGEHATRSDLVLASPTIGNMAPAYSAVRVFWGHPFETPRADEREALVRTFFAASATAVERCRILAQGVSLVYAGAGERRLGAAALERHPGLTPAYTNATVTIYEVSPC